MSLEKAVNHGAHGEHGGKTIDCIHPLGESINKHKWFFSVFSVRSVVIEQRFLG
jgi:hypothetical protein